MSFSYHSRTAHRPRNVYASVRELALAPFFCSLPLLGALFVAIGNWPCKVREPFLQGRLVRVNTNLNSLERYRTIARDQRLYALLTIHFPYTYEYSPYPNEE